MARPIRFEHFQWLGDKRTQTVHDLDQATEACAIDELMASEQFAAFGPDLLAEARNRGYRPCPHCGRAA
jgi:phage terminase large subunit GpA-like protein